MRAARGSGDLPRFAPPRPGSRETLRLFVYGTLQRGQAAHERFCSSLTDVEPATVRGRLHLHPDGYPVLDVAETEVLAVGSADPLADAEAQRRVVTLAHRPAFSRIGHRATDLALAEPDPTSPASLVRGELFTLGDPLATLPPIDRFEEFSATAPSPYRRVLLWVEATARTAAWAYVRGPALTAADLPCLRGGRWPPAHE